MSKHTFRILEFDKVLGMAATFAFTVPGRALIKRIRPLKEIDEIRQQSDLVSECRGFMAEERFPIVHFEDLASVFRRIRPAGALLEPLGLRSFLPLFSSALNLRILSNNPEYPGLGAVVSRLTTHPRLKSSIQTSIGREGEIKDEASPELSHIRKSIRSGENKIKKILEGMLKRKDLAPHLQDFYLAERNNRWVIPVKRDSKRSVPGIVHDISNTGETIYVEPYSIQLPGMELESYRAEEKLEEYRVLSRLSALLREHIHEIEEDYHIVAGLDALQAVAEFSEQMAMSPPEINKRGHLKIVNGLHPLLWKTLRGKNREAGIMPLDLELGGEHSCLVITGSNAGGKTVALKTTGVLTLMALSGMHIPAGSGTTVPFLESVLADIGDEQSIEQDLSTFSAHIKRISEIIRKSSAETLIIIDEFGTGTDPEQGGALSCAILRRLKQRGALTLISTHLGMLKAFAHSEPGLINSAMEMEEIVSSGGSTYRPTYKLVMGEPGMSHAFEIAESLGLDEDVIREAREFMSNEGAALESLISELKRKTGELDDKLKENKMLVQETGYLRSSLKEELAMIRSMKQDILAKAGEEAEEIVMKTRSEARDIIRTLKDLPAPETGKVINHLDRKLVELKKVRKPRSSEKLQRLNKVSEGQRVFIDNLRTDGIVYSVNEKTWKCNVLVNGKKFVVSLNDLSEPAAKPPHASSEGPKAGISRYITGDTELSAELNVIGRRVDPALSLVERYLNDASLSGLKRVKIIHGIGTGRLSRAIRDYLKDHPLVESSAKGDEGEGGGAVTVVFL